MRLKKNIKFSINNNSLSNQVAVVLSRARLQFKPLHNSKVRQAQEVQERTRIKTTTHLMQTAASTILISRQSRISLMWRRRVAQRQVTLQETKLASSRDLTLVRRVRKTIAKVHIKHDPNHAIVSIHQRKTQCHRSVMKTEIRVLEEATPVESTRILVALPMVSRVIQCRLTQPLVAQMWAAMMNLISKSVTLSLRRSCRISLACLSAAVLRSWQIMHANWDLTMKSSGFLSLSCDCKP